MTASVLKGEKQRCLAAGVDVYVSKPVDIDDLQRALRRWIADDVGTAVPSAPAER